MLAADPNSLVIPTHPAGIVGGTASMAMEGKVNGKSVRATNMGKEGGTASMARKGYTEDGRSVAAIEMVTKAREDVPELMREGCRKGGATGKGGGCAAAAAGCCPACGAGRQGLWGCGCRLRECNTTDGRLFAEYRILQTVCPPCSPPLPSWRALPLWRRRSAANKIVSGRAAQQAVIVAVTAQHRWLSACSGVL